MVNLVIRFSILALGSFLLIWNYFLRDKLSIAFLENLSFFGLDNKLIILILGIGIILVEEILSLITYHKEGRKFFS